MDEMRIKKIEFDVIELKRNTKLNSEAIAALMEMAQHNKDILHTLQSLDGWAKKTYEVFEPLARFGVRIAKYSVVFVAAWHAVKWAWAKFMVLT